MRFNEFKPLVERQRPQLPQKYRKATRAVTPTTAPAATAPVAPTTAPVAPTTAPTATAPVAPTTAPAQRPGLMQRMNTGWRNAQAAALKGQRKINPAVTPVVDKGATGVGKISSWTDKMMNYIPNVNLPDITKQGRIDRQAQKIFMKKFSDTMDYNVQSAQNQGLKFNLAGFVDGYMKKNKWQPGQFKTQLDQAIASNDRLGVSKIMAQVGKANTAMYSPTRQPEIAGAFGDGPPPAAPEQEQPAPEKLPMATVSLGGNPNKRNTLNPVDPADAKILSMLKQQGKI